MTVPRCRELLDDVRQVKTPGRKCAVDWTSGSHSLPPPLGLVQKMVEEIEQHTLRINNEQKHTTAVSPTDDSSLQRLPFESLELDEPDLQSEGWSGLTEHYSNGKLDLVYDTKHRDWIPQKHWNFLTQRRNATEANLKDLSCELQENCSCRLLRMGSRGVSGDCAGS